MDLICRYGYLARTHEFYSKDDICRHVVAAQVNKYKDFVYSSRYSVFWWPDSVDYRDETVAASYLEFMAGACGYYSSIGAIVEMDIINGPEVVFRC